MCLQSEVCGLTAGMEISVEEKKVTIKDMIHSVKQLPKTMYILQKADRAAFIKVVLLSILTGIFPIITLLISQELLNSVVMIEKELRYTFYVLAVYIAASFVSYLLEEAYDYVQTMYQYKLQYRLQHMLMQQCTSLSLRDFEASETYDRVEKISGEISYRPFQMFLAVTSLITAFVTLILAVGIIFLWNPLMALLLLTVPIISLFYYLRIGQQEFDMMWNRAKEERKLWYFNHLLTHDFSYKEAKVLGLGTYILDKYKEISSRFIKQNQKILNKKTFFNILYGMIVQGVGFLVIGAAMLAAYMGQILIGSVLSIIRAIGMIQSNSRLLMSDLYSIYSSALYMGMLFEFLKKPKEGQQIEPKQKIKDFSHIEVRNVSFSYDEKKDTLKHISLQISKGECVAIVGPNGSGKSTLLKLLTGLYEPSEGDIYIDQLSMKQIDMENFYSHISVLFQDFVKYEFSLRENVGFGNLKNIHKDEQIIRTLKQLRTDFLLSKEEEYHLEMQLGNWFENGRELSQGQWQKIALARACFKDAMCYILDEPNAALDTVSEREVFQKFFEMSKDKIGIYISHRLSAARMADKIIVMNQGEIIAVGKHEDLLESCKVYQDLYQAENYELESEENAKLCG